MSSFVIALLLIGQADGATAPAEEFPPDREEPAVAPAGAVMSSEGWVPPEHASLYTAIVSLVVVDTPVAPRQFIALERFARAIAMADGTVHGSVMDIVAVPRDDLTTEFRIQVAIDALGSRGMRGPEATIVIVAGQAPRISPGEEVVIPFMLSHDGNTPVADIYKYSGDILYVGTIPVERYIATSISDAE